MNRPIEGRVAIVTGGGQGIGQGIARTLAGGGAHVVIAQRSAESGEAAAEWLRREHDVDAAFLPTDVTSREDIEAMIAATVARFGRLDILVNNAGGSFPKRLENHSDDDMQAGIALNYWSVFWAMRAAFPHLKSAGHGRVINLGSLNGVNAHMFTAAYNASKEAVRALSRTAAVEWGPHGITVNVICPSAASPQAREYFAANPEMHARIVEQVPAGRIGDANDDIGPVALFLASDASNFMTGNTLFADGGGHINGVSWRPEVEE